MPNAGWTVAQLVTQVMGRTENRASNKPNFNPLVEFFLGLDEFCQEKHYWWRRKAASFPTVVGTISYDLSKPTNQGGANAPDCVEIEEAFMVNGLPFPGPRSVHPAFSAREQIGAIYGNNIQPSCIPHSGYFLAPGAFQQWDFTSPPQQVVTVAFTYWAVPMVSNVAGQGSIPLVPPNLHFGLIYMLERRVYEFLYGQNDPRFVTSNARYKDFVNIANKSKQFSSQEAVHSEMQMPSVTASGGHRHGRR